MHVSKSSVLGFLVGALGFGATPVVVPVASAAEQHGEHGHHGEHKLPPFTKLAGILPEPPPITKVAGTFL